MESEPPSAPSANPSPFRSEPALRLGSHRRWRAARTLGPPGGAALIVLRQWLAERRARQLGARFRSTNNRKSHAAYTMMSRALFRGINARRAWANTQAIAKTLHRRAPTGPLLALDLACGDGTSCAMLSHYLPPGSRLLGMEFAPLLAQLANQRSYRHGNGEAASVQVLCANILEPFSDADGSPLPAASVDWINCTGALAHHFSDQQIATIARECARVLRPGGWAAVDARSAKASDVVRQAFAAVGLRFDGCERSCLIDRYPQCCFQKM